MYYMAACMKNVKPMVSLPEIFREKMTLHQINQLVLLQLYINKISLFIFMCAMPEDHYQGRLNLVPTWIQKHLKKKGEKEKTFVFESCCAHLDQLKALVAKVHMSQNKKQQFASHIMLAWKREIESMLNYKHHIEVEDLGELSITFDYFLVSLWFGNDISDDLGYFMEMAGGEEELASV